MKGWIKNKTESVVTFAGALLLLGIVEKNIPKFLRTEKELMPNNSNYSCLIWFQYYIIDFFLFSNKSHVDIH